MRTLLYVHPVAIGRVEEFLRIAAEASARYLAHGALSDDVVEVVDGSGRYGLLGLDDQLERMPDERIFIGITTFHDQGHLDEVMARVDADPMIDDLFNQMSTVVEMRRVVRAECETVNR